MSKYAHMSKEELLLELAGRDASAAEALRSREEHYHVLFGNMDLALAELEVVLDACGRPADFRYRCVNPQFEAETGLNCAHVLGKTIREVLPDAGEWWLDAFRRVVTGGERLSFVSYGSHTDKTYEVHASTPGQGRLTVLFKNISERKHAEQARRESEAHYQAMVKSFDGLMYVCSRDYRIHHHNEAMLAHLGRDATGELCYRALYGLDAVCPWCVNDRAFAGESVRWVMQNFKDRRWYEVSSIPVRKLGGRVSRKQVMIADITDRKQLEEALLQSKRELELANEKLEQKVAERTAELVAAVRAQESFSYSVSHDLRAPLRHMNSFSALLLEDYGDSLPPQARGYLDRICAASGKLGSLIDHLLELSRVTRAALKIETVDLTDIACSTLEMYRDLDPQRRVELVIQGGIKVQGDGALLRQLLENLLGNAWKYTSKKRSATIEFGSKREDGEEVYFVADDGAGFDMSYCDKLFRPFERLHGSEFEGLGIGLATTQHIVQRHGGRIWSEGEVGRGAVFYFTLPRKQHFSPGDARGASRYSA